MQFPVFVVGSPRSGTSILTAALHRAGYFGFNEGNFLTLIGTLDRVIDQHFRIFDNGTSKILISHVDKDALKSSLFEILCKAEDQANANAPWMDKTGNPEMIYAIPALLRYWPTAHFIFAKRRAIENIASRIKKFPRHTFEYHCLDWARNMQAWRLIRQQIPTLRSIDVDQYDIRRVPEDTARRIATFLQLAPEGQTAMSQAFANERPQQTADGTAERILSFETCGWSPQQLDKFKEICSEEMSSYGYTTDEAYWSNQHAYVNYSTDDTCITNFSPM